MSEEPKKLPYIATKIKELREEVDWNQAALAKASGVSPAAISLFEKGERIPSMIITRKLASALKVSIDDLTGEVSKSSKSISNEATVFFRDWQELDKLEESDKKMIKEIVSRLRDKDK